jgi:DNA-binding MarR family transcriptional regulator
MSTASRIAAPLHSGMVRLNKKIAIVDRATDISAARLSVLAVLTFGGSKTIGSLSLIEGVKPPTMSNLINALEKDGMVVRKTTEADARQSVVSVTKKGVSLLEKARQNRLTYLRGLLESLSKDELSVLEKASSILLRLSETVE